MGPETVGGGVALVPEDDAGCDGQEVVAVVPLLAGGAVLVDGCLEHPQPVEPERLGHDGERGAVYIGHGFVIHAITHSASARRTMPSLVVARSIARKMERGGALV